MNKAMRIMMSIVALVAVAIIPAVSAGSAEATTTKHIVFKAFGSVGRATVETWGNYDITRQRALPFRQSEYNNSWSQFMSVETSGYRYVGCAIYVNGVLRARDISHYGVASCLVNTMR
jgi:hypothetical protein